MPEMQDALTTAPSELWVDGVFYPCSDGKPMAENMWQWRAINAAANDLDAALPTALVAADILVYPERGNSRNSIAPDVLVALDLGKRNRNSYYVWREGKPPDWVLEVASQSTARRDLDEKHLEYAEMGVPEFWLFDPKGDVYRRGEPRLQGLTLVGGKYVPLEAAIVDGVAAIRSEVLRMDVCVEGELLRFRHVATGERIRHPAEEVVRADLQAVRAEREAVRAEREATRASTAEARAAELERQLRRQQAEKEGRRPA